MRYRMLRLLGEHPEMSQRELAREIGASLGATHYCLNALIEKGLVMIRRFSRSTHKQRCAYVLTPAGIASKSRLTKRFLHRKWAEYRALKDEIEALEREIDISRKRTVAENDRTAL